MEPSNDGPASTSPDDSRRPHDGVASVIASDEQLALAFVSQISEVVDARIREREGRRQRLSAIVFSVLGLIGFTGITAWISLQVNESVRKQLPVYVDSAVAGAVDEAIVEETTALRTEIRNEAAYQQFAYMALSLDLKTDGFSPDERDAVLDLLDKIATSKELRTRSEFPVLLEKVLDRFAQADLDAAITQVAKAFPKVTTGSVGITQTLVNHYGQRLLGDARPIDRWPKEKIGLFETYELAAEAHQSPELSLPYRLLFEYRRSGGQSTREIRNLLEGAAFWPDSEERASLHSKLIKLCNTANWMARPTGQGLQIEETCTQFRATFEDEIRRQMSDPEVINSLMAYAAIISTSPAGFHFAGDIQNEVNKVLPNVSSPFAN